MEHSAMPIYGRESTAGYRMVDDASGVFADIPPTPVADARVCWSRRPSGNCAR